MVICLFIYFLMFLLTSYLTESLWWRCQPRRLSQGWRRKWREGEDKGAARGGAHPQSEGSPGAGNQCHWPSLRAAGHSHSRLRLRGRGNCIPDGPTSGGKGTRIDGIYFDIHSFMVSYAAMMLFESIQLIKGKVLKDIRKKSLIYIIWPCYEIKITHNLLM